MAENKFTPPEAENFRAHGQPPESAPPQNEPDSAEISEPPEQTAVNLPANFDLKLKKLTQDFAFSQDPQAKDFLRLAGQINNLSDADLSQGKLAALKAELSQALAQAEDDFSTSTKMFSQVLSAFENSPQQFKKAYLQKQKNSTNNPEGFSSYLQTTYRRAKLRRLRDVYLGLTEKLRQYENAYPAALERVVETTPASAVATAEPVTASVSVAKQSEIAFSVQNLDGATIDNTANNHNDSGKNIGDVNDAQSEQNSSQTTKDSGREGGDKKPENKFSLYDSFAEQINKLQATIAGVETPNTIGVEGVGQYFTLLEDVNSKLKALDYALSTHNDTLSMADLMKLREDFEKASKQYSRLANQADYDFSQKRILVPQMWVSEDVRDLAEKLAHFYKETDDEIERSAALQIAKEKAAEVTKYLQSEEAKNLHYEVYDYINDLLMHIENERIIPSKNAAVEAMRKAKSFPDALEWLFYNASAKGDPVHIAKTIEVFQKRASSHYDNLLKNKELGESERQVIEKAKKQAKDFMKVMWDNALNGNYANDNVSLGSGRLRLAKGATKNERALIENFVKAADKGAAERANNQLNMNEMFHTLVIEGEGDKKTMITEHFDWVTQGKRETVSSDKDRSIGPLQEIIYLIYQKHIINRNDKRNKYSFEKLFYNLQDGASQENGALMDALVDAVLGKNAQELKQHFDEESDPNFKAVYQRIYEQLQYHSEEMFAVFKAGVQYKIARDNLTELAAFQNAALNGASLPNVGGNELKKGSFGTMASIPVQLLRFRSGKVEDAPKTLPLVASAFNIDKVLNTTATTMGGSDFGMGSKHWNIIRDLKQFILKYKHVNEVVMRPQLKDLLPDITSKLSYWWQGGMPPEAYALNSGKSLSAWKNAEEAMMKLQKIAAMSETRYNDDFLNNDNYQVSQRELNTIVSIIQGYTGTTSKFTDNSEAALEFWQNRNEKLAQNDGSIDYVDINVISLYLSAMTYEVIGNPSDERTTGRNGNQESYDRHIENKRRAVVIGAGEDNALKKDLYLPIVKDFFGDREAYQHGKIKLHRDVEVGGGFLGLFNKLFDDNRNDFMIPSRDSKYYDPALKTRIKDYITTWLNKKPNEEQIDEYDYTAESEDLDVAVSKTTPFSFNVGVTPRDRELRLMNHNPAVVVKITDKHTL